MRTAPRSCSLTDRHLPAGGGNVYLEHTVKTGSTRTPTTIPIHALLADGLRPNLDPDYRPLLLSADLVFGRDVTSGREFLVYGRQFLERIVRTPRGRPARVVRIELDQDTDELEVLCTVIEALRGRCDYEGGAD